MLHIRLRLTYLQVTHAALDVLGILRPIRVADYLHLTREGHCKSHRQWEDPRSYLFVHIILCPERIYNSLHKAFVAHLPIPLSQVAYRRTYRRDTARLHRVLHRYPSVK